MDGLAERPEAKNLVTIYSVLAGEAPEAVLARFAGQGFGAFKPALADLVVETMRPIKSRFEELRGDRERLDRILARARRRRPRQPSRRSTPLMRRSGSGTAAERQAPDRSFSGRSALFCRKGRFPIELQLRLRSNEDAYHVPCQEVADPRRAGGPARARRLRDRPSDPGFPLPGDARPRRPDLRHRGGEPDDRGGLEFSRYAELVRRHMIAQGYSEAARPAAGLADRVARLRSRRRPPAGRHPARLATALRTRVRLWRLWRLCGYGGFGYRPYWSRFGGYGRLRSPFYYGWDDPFWYRGHGEEIDVYTVL
jgi:hypothetical protein